MPTRLSNRGSWRLVWCHERCHKLEHEPRREAMRVAREEFQVSMVSLRKAKNFALWIQASPRHPFVLLTDWREAQHCRRALELHQGGNIPVFTVILCDSTKQRKVASAWVQSVLGSKGGPPVEANHIHVCERSAIPKELCGGLLHQVFGLATPLAQPQLQGTLPAALLEKKLLGADDSHGYTDSNFDNASTELLSSDGDRSDGNFSDHDASTPHENTVSLSSLPEFLHLSPSTLPPKQQVSSVTTAAVAYQSPSNMHFQQQVIHAFGAPKKIQLPTDSSTPTRWPEEQPRQIQIHELCACVPASPLSAMQPMYVPLSCPTADGYVDNSYFMGKPHALFV